MLKPNSWQSWDRTGGAPHHHGLNSQLRWMDKSHRCFQTKGHPAAQAISVRLTRPAEVGQAAPFRLLIQHSTSASTLGTAFGLLLLSYRSYTFTQPKQTQ